MKYKKAEFDDAARYVYEVATRKEKPAHGRWHDEFCAINTGAQWLTVSRTAPLRPQIVPWSTRVVPIGCVMIQSLPRAADCYVTATQCARPCGSVRASGSIIEGPGQEGAIAKALTSPHYWMNSPSSGRIQPTIHL